MNRSSLFSSLCVLGVLLSASLQRTGAAPNQPQLLTRLSHQSYVTAIVVSPNKRFVVSADYDGYVIVWDAASGRALRSWNTHDGNNAVTFSPDSSTVAVVGHSINSSGVQLWNVTTGTRIGVLTSSSANDVILEGIKQLKFSPDGSLLGAIYEPGLAAVNTYRSNLLLWDLHSRKEIRRFKLAQKDFGDGCLAFSPDGRRIATVTTSLEMWDVSSGERLFEVPDKTGWCRAAGFTSDGKHIVKVDSGSLAIFDLEARNRQDSEYQDGQPEKEDRMVTFSRPITLSSDTRLLATGVLGIQVRQGTSGSVIRTLDDRDASTTAAGLSEDGDLLAVGSLDGNVRIWHTADGKLAADGASGLETIMAVRVAANSRELYAATAKGGIETWDLQSGRLLDVTTLAVDGLRMLAFSSDNGAVVTSGVSGGVRTWDRASGRLKQALTEEGSLVTALAFSPDSARVAVADSKGYLRVWDVNSKHLLFNKLMPELDSRFKGAQPIIYSVAFSPDGSRLAAGSDRSAVYILDPATGATLMSRDELILNGVISGISYSPDGSRLAINADRAIAEVTLDSKIHVRPIQWAFEYESGDISYSPDGRMILVGRSDSVAEIWDAASGKRLRSLSGNQTRVQAVTFSRDGSLAVSGAADGTLNVWSAATGTHRAELLKNEAGDWITLTPKGYFVASEHGGREINVRVGNEVFGIERFRERFYRPDLVHMSLAGDQAPDTLPTIDTAKPPPDVALVDPPRSIDSDVLKLRVRLTDRGGGVGRIRVYVNKTEILPTSGRDLRVEAVNTGQLRTFELRLPPGENEIGVVAFNAEDTLGSNLAKAKVAANYSLTQPQQLWALLVGIDNFDLQRLHLDFPAADAKALANRLIEKNGTLFSKVNVEILTSQSQTTKQALLDALARYRTRVAPNDTFVFFAATHGDVEANLNTREYYLIPSNVTGISDDLLRAQALSQTDLGTAIGAIPVTRKLVLLDTCHAGAGGAEIMARLANLSLAVGITVLAASATDQQALEGYEGHGLFTWAVLDGLTGKAAAAHMSSITTFDLATYVSHQVPTLSQRLYGQPQSPELFNGGAAFPIVSVQ